MTKLSRLDNILISRGFGNRKIAKDLITSGKVSVNGAVIKSSSVKVDETNSLLVNGIPSLPTPILAAFHKPKGVLSVLKDPLHRPTILSALPDPWRTIVESKVMHPVGRLDLETSGLLLLSQDGMLTDAILSPDLKIEKEYVAKVELNEVKKDNQKCFDELRKALENGIELSDGPCTASLVSFEGDIVRLILDEGRHRVVRRTLFNAGYPVIGLHRNRIENIVLDELEIEEGQVVPIPLNVFEELKARIEKMKSCPKLKAEAKRKREYQKEKRIRIQAFDEIFS